MEATQRGLTRGGSQRGEDQKSNQGKGQRRHLWRKRKRRPGSKVAGCRQQAPRALHLSSATMAGERAREEPEPKVEAEVFFIAWRKAHTSHCPHTLRLFFFFFLFNLPRKRMQQTVWVAPERSHGWCGSPQGDGVGPPWQLRRWLSSHVLTLTKSNIQLTS